MNTPSGRMWIGVWLSGDIVTEQTHPRVGHKSVDSTGAVLQMADPA